MGVSPVQSVSRTDLQILQHRDTHGLHQGLVRESQAKTEKEVQAEEYKLLRCGCTVLQRLRWRRLCRCDHLCFYIVVVLVQRRIARNRGPLQAIFLALPLRLVDALTVYGHIVLVPLLICKGVFPGSSPCFCAESGSSKFVKIRRGRNAMYCNCKDRRSQRMEEGSRGLVVDRQRSSIDRENHRCLDGFSECRREGGR